MNILLGQTFIREFWRENTVYVVADFADGIVAVDRGTPPVLMSGFLIKKYEKTKG
jgi:hypothetical protein